MTGPSSGDRQLVDAVLAGSSEAFRVLVERESALVIGVCRRILGDPDEAQDVAQDAFLRAYRSLATYRGEGAFGAWVTRIAARMSVARLAARGPLVSIDPAVAETWVAGESDENPEARALDGEQRRAIMEAIAGLPASQRDVITMRFYGDLTLDEIAETTDAPLGTVKSRLHRGLATLRDQIAPRSTP
ncbi:MAG: sigma-70 family RNA polymerase sigma factor [Chloroflexota bacterium]|nr:sigma-70 family RNA polymerase sigma factor [Chloroflexota bacterium]